MYDPHKSWRLGYHMPCRGTGEEPGFGQVTVDRVRGELRPWPLLGVSAGKAREGKQLRIGSLNNLGRL